MINITKSHLSPTEQRSVPSMHIDTMSSLELVTLINQEDSQVPSCVAAILPRLAAVVDQAVKGIEAGGRIHYFGAGSSGRFGVIDAAEVSPTYGVSPRLVTAHMAGGDEAMQSAIEDAEDDGAAGADEAHQAVEATDIVFGLAASGRTPYVAKALSAAQKVGAFTVAVTSNPDSPIGLQADVHLCVETGPEVVTGSTRMKAGTAQKLVLHTFSTALMVRLGRTFSNLMIDLVPSNAKLRRRVVQLLAEAGGASEEQAADALTAADGDSKVALLVLLFGLQAIDAKARLDEADGSLRPVIADLRTQVRPSAQRRACLGIDVGASGFRIALSDEAGRVEAERGNNGSVIGATGFQTNQLFRSISEALARMRASGRATEVDTATVGIAGGAYFQTLLRPLGLEIGRLIGARQIALAPDIVPSYVGALGFHPGATLAAGTGAVALGVNNKGETRQVDGLGHLLGDLGSGAWIGLQALKAALAADKETGPASTLLTVVREQFGDTATAVHEIYSAEDRSAVLASLVPAVLSAATEDPEASALIDQATSHLEATLSSAGYHAKGAYAAVGGLVSPGSEIRRRLAERMDLAVTRHSAAVGATEIAEAVRDSTLPEWISSKLTLLSSQ